MERYLSFKLSFFFLEFIQVKLVCYNDNNNLKQVEILLF